jgi:hypothetical protein
VSAENPDEPGEPRKPYEKPRLFEVALRPDEAVLGSCKTMVSAGPLEASCGAMGTCFTIGS